ncbi:MAG: cation:proton antiporter [Actinobacteria bacterium]|nr:MAG: cation:proton antiporter [Actinomycetota bacterium]
MEGISHSLLNLFLVFVGAKIAGEVFERLRQPAVIGELLAGVIMGPYALGIVGEDVALQVVSTLGVVILMFYVGLETRRSEILKVGRAGVLVGTLGIILPLVCGFAFGRALGRDWAESLFIGTALVATSVGITARVLSDRGLLSTRLARIIITAAVVDDVLGLVVLSAVSGVVKGSLDVGRVSLVGLEAVAFVVAIVVVLPWVVVKSETLLDRLHISNAPFAVAVGSMLLFAAIAESIGLAAIVGAFFAGMGFAEGPDRWELQQRTEPLYEWLVPFFFVLMGTRVNIGLFTDAAVLVPGLALVGIAVATKVIGCGLAVANEGPRPALAVGVGMVPRGEVGLIVAAMGQSLGVVSEPVFAMIVMVVAASTLIAPPLLPALFRLARATSDVSAGSPVVDPETL